MLTVPNFTFTDTQFPIVMGIAVGVLSLSWTAYAVRLSWAHLRHPGKSGLSNRFGVFAFVVSVLTLATWIIADSNARDSIDEQHVHARVVSMQEYGYSNIMMQYPSFSAERDGKFVRGVLNRVDTTETSTIYEIFEAEPRKVE